MMGELLEWANSLGVAEFRRSVRFGEDVAMAESGAAVMVLGYGRFSDGEHMDALLRGKPAVGIDYQERNGSYFGMSCLYLPAERGKLERAVRLYAKRGGFEPPAMESLFAPDEDEAWAAVEAYLRGLEDGRRGE